MSKFYSQAEKAFAAGKPAEALKLCAAVAPSSAEALDAKALAAECLAELGRWNEADEKARVVLAEDDEWATGHLIRGLAAVKAGKFPEAKGALEKALGLDETLSEAAWALATLCDYQGEFAKADKWMVLAHKHDPELPAPKHFSAAELDEALVAAVDEFPEEAGRILNESRIRIAAMPSAADLAAGIPLDGEMRIVEMDPDGDPPSASLVLFQRNLEREALDLDDLAENLVELLGETVTALTKPPKTPKSQKSAKPAKKPAPQATSRPAVKKRQGAK